jgi:hypothetical protein
MKAFEITALTLAGIGGAILIGTAIYHAVKKTPVKP